METAILWRCKTPTEFHSFSAIDRAIMTAHYRERNLRKAMADKISHEVYQKEAKKDESKTASPAYDPIAAFLGPGPVG